MIRKIFITIVLLAGFEFSISQKWEVEIFGGVSNYQGDLQPEVFTFKNARPAFGINGKYGLTENIFLRSGFAFGTVIGDDARNKESLQARNLSFQSGVQEFHVGIEYRVFKPEKSPITPYFFAGIGIFHFNPFTRYGADNKKIYLQPLGTEGQGLPEYPQREPYKLVIGSIPYGGGIKWQVNCNLYVGAEFRQSKVFTDYLDDVSTTYPDQGALLRGNGQLAVDLSWRGDEYNGRPYPREGAIRGNPKEDDWYYYTGFTIGLSVFDCDTGTFSLGGLFGGGGATRRGSRKNGMACPKW